MDPSRTIEVEGSSTDALLTNERAASGLERLIAWARGLPWVFSFERDIFLLGLPLLATLGLLLLDHAFGVGGTNFGHRTLFTFSFAMMTFIDTGHLLSTTFRSYLDEQVRRNHRRLLYLGPIVIIATNIFVERTLGLRYVVYLFAYLNIYHLMRQQYGWVAITARKAGKTTPIETLIDKGAVYALFIFPTIWAHVSLQPNERRIPLSPNLIIAHGAVACFTASVCAYGAWRGYHWIRCGRVNIPKLIVVGSTALTWGGVMFLRSRFWPFVSTIYHSVPYVGLIFLSARARSTDTYFWERLWRWRYGALLFGVATLAVGYSWTQVLKVFARVPLQDVTGFSVVCIANVLPIMHYLIDGVIWRKGSFNPSAET